MTLAVIIMTLAKNFEVIADAVCEKGKTDQKQTDYDAFWDMYQNYGDNTEYSYHFVGTRFQPDMFYPKYDIKPKGMAYIFEFFNRDGETLIDLDERLKKCGVTLDTSNCTGVTWAFYFTGLDNIPPLDLQKCTSLHQLFAKSKTITIQKIILNSNGSTSHTNSFDECTNLTHIRFEGAIGNTINFGDCPLDAFSILGDLATEEQIAEGKNLYLFGGNYYFGGIMGALMDNPVGTNPTITFKKSIVEQHFGGTEGDMWLALVGSKPNWNFATK